MTPNDRISLRSCKPRSAQPTFTRQLLAFGRRQLLQPAVLELNSLVAGAESAVRRVLTPNITLHMVLGETVGQVRIDQADLGEAVVNLVLNARDAMPQGGRLTLETTTVVVADNAGLGRAAQ